MGNCQRRNSINNAINTDVEQEQEQEQEWLLIPAQPRTPGRFHRAVRTIIKLLKLRIVFAHAGHYLDNPISRRHSNRHIRAVMTEIFTRWPRTVLRGTKAIFDHVKRVNGVLVYK